MKLDQLLQLLDKGNINSGHLRNKLKYAKESFSIQVILNNHVSIINEVCANIVLHFNLNLFKVYFPEDIHISGIILGLFKDIKS